MDESCYEEFEDTKMYDIPELDANKEATESRVPNRYAEVATKTLLTV
jgi:hypothetical protein